MTMVLGCLQPTHAESSVSDMCDQACKQLAVKAPAWYQGQFSQQEHLSVIGSFLSCCMGAGTPSGVLLGM